MSSSLTDSLRWPASWSRRPRTAIGILAGFTIISFTLLYFDIPFRSSITEQNLPPVAVPGNGVSGIHTITRLPKEPVRPALPQVAYPSHGDLLAFEHPKNVSERARRVREAFLHSWKGYERYAFGKDELLPVSNSSVQKCVQIIRGRSWY